MTLGGLSKMRFLLAAFLVGVLVHKNKAVADETQSSSVVLTKDTFDELTAKKTVFIKFFAPWCGHCKELAPKWDQMASEWMHHDQGLVASVDCSIEKFLCEKQFQIQGLPTLLYGDATNSGMYLEEYHGEKTYEVLSQFANDTLSKPHCSPASPEHCKDEATRRQMDQISNLSLLELESAIEKKENEIQQSHDNFALQYKAMQATYDQLATHVESNKARINKNIKMLKAVLETKKL